MERTTLVLLFAALALPVSSAQDRPKSGDNAAQPHTAVASAPVNPNLPEGEANSSEAGNAVGAHHQSESLGVGAKFRYYLGETYLTPSFLTAPAFRASIRMSNPPGHFPTSYPADWRQGAEAFGKNYGDAMAQRVSFQTGRFATGALIHEDPRYAPSSSHNVLIRSLHAFSYTFVDRSDSGHRMPAISNFVGVAAAGFVGNTYLPPGFANVTHAGQRATLQLGFFAVGNLYREFAPQMPKPVRMFFELIGR